jgi:Raf kinase inhibitor-like YbhB/YbcL family protein
MARWGIFVLLVLVAGCGGGEKPTTPVPDAPPDIELTSSAFREGEPIPKKYTCDGSETSPPLAWAGAPQATKELALLVDDPDAPGGTYTHWTVYGIPPSTRKMAEGRPPRGARQGENSFGDEKYGGPCPPKGGGPHDYVFQLYALKAPLGLQAGAKPDAVRQAIAKQALARGRLVGTFKRG